MRGSASPSEYIAEKPSPSADASAVNRTILSQSDARHPTAGMKHAAYSTSCSMWRVPMLHAAYRHAAYIVPEAEEMLLRAIASDDALSVASNVTPSPSYTCRAQPPPGKW